MLAKTTLQLKITLPINTRCIKIFYRCVSLCALVSLLAACSSTPSNSSRYSMRHDAGPDRILHASDVQDAVPQKVVRTKAGNKSPYTVLGKTYYVMPDSKGFTQVGMGSWYGKKFHGHQTSNGEIYDMYGMTAAHKTLPIPTYVRVTNLENGLSTVVRVNDRGPFHGGRIIDLSYAAATKLNYAGQGTARLKVEALEAGESYQVKESGSAPAPVAVEPSPKPVKPAVQHTVAPAVAADEQNYQLPGNTYLQVAAFVSEGSAEQARKRLTDLTEYPIKISLGHNNLHKVLIGPITDNFDLLNLRQLLISQHFGTPHIVYD